MKSLINFQPTSKKRRRFAIIPFFLPSEHRTFVTRSRTRFRQPTPSRGVSVALILTDSPRGKFSAGFVVGADELDLDERTGGAAARLA